MQLAAFDIKAGHVGRPSRHNDRAIIFLGQALQPFASVHGIAYGGGDLAPTMASLKWMPIPIRIGCGKSPRNRLLSWATRASISRAPRKASAAPIAGFLTLRP